VEQQRPSPAKQDSPNAGIRAFYFQDHIPAGDQTIFEMFITEQTFVYMIVRMVANQYEERRLHANKSEAMCVDWCDGSWYRYYWRNGTGHGVSVPGTARTGLFEKQELPTRYARWQG
jgi:hypothetical protein